MNLKEDADNPVCPWQQDRKDYSWTLTDDDGCFYRASRVDREAWAIAWTETRWDGIEPIGPAVRIGLSTYRTLEEAKAAIENLAVFERSS
jgi:hypothetical protein